MRSASEVLKQVQEYVEYLRGEGESDLRCVRDYISGIRHEINKEQEQTK